MFLSWKISTVLSSTTMNSFDAGGGTL